MAIKFSTTDKASVRNGIKCCVYGVSGVGKTTLASTVSGAFLISAEAGELSLRQFSIPMATINNIDELIEVYDYFAQGLDQWQFTTIFLDSISEIGEVVLNNAKKTSKDPRLAYGVLADRLEEVIRKFRDLPCRNIVFIAKQEHVKDEVSGITMYGPSLPGNKLVQKLPYFFDLVLRMGVNKTQDGQSYRYLQTQPDIQYTAKDRSGMLDSFEPPNLAHVFSKIIGNSPI